MNLIIANYDDLDMDPDTTTTWEGKRFSGLAYELLGNGNIANDFFYNGIMWGPSRIWAPNGQLLEEWWHFGVDSFHGVNRTWNLEGDIQSAEEFWKGKRVAMQEWGDDGTIIQSERLFPEELANIGYIPDSWMEYYHNAGDSTDLWQLFEKEYGGRYFPPQ